MAVASLARQLTDYQQRACAELYNGDGVYANLDTVEQAEVDRLILDAELEFWTHPPVDPPWVWSCLRNPGALDLWSDVAVSASVTVAQSGSTTLTATGGTPFYPTMVGKSIVITGQGTKTITAYTSSTVVTVSSSGTYSGATFSIASDGIYRLPSDFDSPDASTLVFTSVSWYPDIQLRNEKDVNALRATQAQVSYPECACIRWVTSDGTAGQLQELVTWPEPDQYYGVALPYIAQPQGMSTANPYPRGGPEMADCIMAMVLAYCESAANGVRGARWAEARARCQLAARRDQARHHNFVAGQMRPDAGRRVSAFDVKRLILPA